jgi:hypothetical protein
VSGNSRLHLLQTFIAWSTVLQLEVLQAHGHNIEPAFTVAFIENNNLPTIIVTLFPKVLFGLKITGPDDYGRVLRFGVYGHIEMLQVPRHRGALTGV